MCCERFQVRGEDSLTYARNIGELAAIKERLCAYCFNHNLQLRCEQCRIEQAHDTLEWSMTRPRRA